MNDTKPQKSKGKRPIAEGAAAKNPVRRFLLVFALTFGGFMALTYYVLYTDPIFGPVASISGKICAVILSPFLDNVQSQGDLLRASGFSIAIKRGCDPFQASAVLLAGILAFPATWKERTIGALLGLIFLFLLNIFRLCVMLLVGLYQRSWFETFHLEIMPVVFIAAALGAWMLWAMKVGNNPKAQAETA